VLYFLLRRRALLVANSFRLLSSCYYGFNFIVGENLEFGWVWFTTVQVCDFGSVSCSWINNPGKELNFSSGEYQRSVTTTVSAPLPPVVAGMKRFQRSPVTYTPAIICGGKVSRDYCLASPLISPQDVPSSVWLIHAELGPIVPSNIGIGHFPSLFERANGDCLE
jgi:hypothetical protein